MWMARLLNPWALPWAWWWSCFFASRMLLSGVDWYVKQQAIKAADSDDDDTDDDDDGVHHPSMINHYELFHAVNAFQEHVFLHWAMFTCHRIWKDPWQGLSGTTISVALMFVAMDAVYMMAHRAMHTRRLYTHVHKYHHVSKNPRNGYADAAFTHPLEHCIGLTTVFVGMFVAHHLTGGASVPAVATFIGLHGVLSITNHLKGSLGAFHRTHHRHLTCNYAQHIQLLDRVAGTFRAHPRIQVGTKMCTST